MGRISSFPERLKKRVSNLSWYSAHSADPRAPQEAHSAGALGEEEEKLPAPPSDFPNLLQKKRDTSARELVPPYLEYETSLRKVFASEAKGMGAKANLVPVYGSHEDLFTIRGVDREKGDGEKYLMSLPDSERESEGALAIAPSFEEFERNFDAFTHGWLRP